MLGDWGIGGLRRGCEDGRTGGWEYGSMQWFDCSDLREVWDWELRIED